MTQASREERFRQAAEAEDGMPISAGARVFHVRSAVESGRALYVDLSGVPDEKRPAVVAEIKELVHRASLKVPRQEVQHAPDGSSTSG
jgi:hypothetical protein